MLGTLRNRKGAGVVGLGGGGREGRVVKGVVREEENAALGGREQISHMIFLMFSDVPSGCHVGLEV